MAQLLNPVKNFFASHGQPKTQEFIRLQLLFRSEHPAAPGADINDGDNFERGSASLYSLLRFVKVVSSAWNDRLPGWRSGIAGFTILASIVLMLNISALAWTATHLDDGHYATLAVGSYQRISNLSGWVHFGINILSNALLVGSNYCMQCLSSPTRAEVDAAHARGSYLNIGTLSWRNVLASRKRRICLLSLLTLSSVVMHPVYDTSFVTTTALQSYTSALVTPDFRVLSYDDFAHINQSNFPLSYSGTNRTDRLRYIQNMINDNQILDTSLWENMSAVECSKYNVFQTERSTLLIMINETPEQLFSTQDPSLLPYGSSAYSHLLPAFIRNQLYPVYKTAEKDWANTSKWHTRISYCLSRKVPGRSRLQIHLWLLLTATVLNAIKLSCLTLTSKEQQGTPLITTGDAVASFLSSRCVHSAGMCLLSEEELVRKLEERRNDNEVDATPAYKRFSAMRLRYYRSVSFSRWVVYISSFLLIMLFSVYGYERIKKHFKATNTDYDLHSLWKIGFGNLDEHSLTEITLCDFMFSSVHDNAKWVKCRIAYGSASTMILTNLPQLAVSAMYLCLNHQLTLMIQLRDWTRLASRRQPLRVSDPEPSSDQVSTYWLSLPYRYSIPLLLTSVSLGWLVSQTLFIVRYALYDDISIDEVSKISYTMGFSAIALIFSLGFGLAIFGVSVAIGFCSSTCGMPLGPSNSLIIAAACHPPETDCYAARKMVKWGAIPTGGNDEEDNPSYHCTITSQRVEDPIEGRWYG